MVMGGRACIRGMRITGALVVNLVANGMSAQDMMREYPLWDSFEGRLLSLVEVGQAQAVLRRRPPGSVLFATLHEWGLHGPGVVYVAMPRGGDGLN